MSQRIENINANFITPHADPAQTNNIGGIEGIVGGAIVLRVGANGPSGVSNQQTNGSLPVTVTPSFTRT